MTIALAPTQSKISEALRAFVVAVVGADVPVVLGQVNRVPEPMQGNYVVFWPLSRPRLSTNVREYADCCFTASIAGTTLTVSAILIGTVRLGATLFGVDIPAGITIEAQLSGTPGGVGTYRLSASLTIASETMASGATSILQPTMVRMQLDVHGDDGDDNAQKIATLLRDPYAVEKMAAVDPSVVPLYAEDPRQIPFTNAEQQVETRYVVEAVLQANQVVTIPQQFAGSLVAGLINVDAAYPAA